MKIFSNNFGTSIRGLSALLPAILLSALGAACSTTPSVKVQTAPGLDLTRYDTFAFVSPLGTDRSGYASFLSQDLKQATQSALEAKGYKYSESAPKMLVNFTVNVSVKTQVDPAPLMAAGPWGFRAGLYGAWPGYAFPGTINQYQQGTLLLDLVDPEKKQLIWEGSDNTTAYDLSKVTDAQIQKAIGAITAKIPAVGTAASATE